MTDITGPKISFGDKATRKRRRLERELRALHTMQAHLNLKDIACSILAILGLALLCLGVAFKLRLVSGSIPIALIAAAAGGIAIWWIGRRWFNLAVLIVYGLLLVLLETCPDFWPDQKNSKASRQEKLQCAIAKREAKLRELHGIKL